MSYVLAVVIVGQGQAPSSSHVGPFTEKTSCMNAAREMVTDGSITKESDDMITAKVSVMGGDNVYFYYRLNCVRQ